MRDAWRIEIVRVLRRIAQHLEALQVVLESRNKEEHAKAKNEQANKAQGGPQIQQAPVLVKVESLERLIEDPQTKTDQQSWNKKNFRLNCFLAVVLTVTLVFVGLQWLSMVDTLKEMQEQTQPMIDAAKAATSAADTSAAALRDSQRSFRIQNRPYVTVEIARLVYRPEGGKRLEGTLLIRNSGHTPAIGLRPDISIEGRTSELPAVITRTAAVKSRMDIGSTQPAVVPVPGGGPIRPDSALKIESGEVVVYIYGFLDYSDVFGCTYTTEFCGYYDPVMGGEEPLVLSACRNHNRLIENTCDK